MKQVFTFAVHSKGIAHILFNCPSTDNTNMQGQIKNSDALCKPVNFSITNTCFYLHPLYTISRSIFPKKSDVNLEFMDDSAALLHPWQHGFKCVQAWCLDIGIKQRMWNGADEGKSKASFVLIADTGWWPQKTVTWWRADRSHVSCCCLWPATELMFVSVDQAWRSCNSPWNSRIIPSSTAGFASEFYFDIMILSDCTHNCYAVYFYSPVDMGRESERERLLLMLFIFQ